MGDLPTDRVSVKAPHTKRRKKKDMRRLASLWVVVGTSPALGLARAYAGGSPPLSMTDDPGSVSVGEPVTPTIREDQRPALRP